MQATPLLLLLAAVVLQTCTALPACLPCGNQSIPYPLSTGSHCGDARYKIRCINNATLLFDSTNNIIHISAQTQRIIIEPSNLIPNTCVTADYPANGLQLNDSGPFNITGQGRSQGGSRVVGRPPFPVR
ncbi:hypothetical protein CASFOL_006594 [Castilleja foliolosa]|uniref:Wall-associated receptor kinase galacturonan-binding domain-containing protein n=1 Tax=Castilleja foliolosa TaxID=1961234 RepID=A0ABD3E7T7_9LAMI